MAQAKVFDAVALRLKIPPDRLPSVDPCQITEAIRAMNKCPPPDRELPGLLAEYLKQRKTEGAAR